MTHDRVGERTDPPVRTWSGQRWLRLASMLLPLIAIVAFLSACDFTGKAMTIEYKSPEAKEIWNLYSLVWWLAVAVFVVVEAALFYSVIRFRRRPGQGLPKQIHGNNQLEIAWTIVPALLLVLIAVPTVQGIVSASSAAPADALPETGTKRGGKKAYVYLKKGETIIIS